MFTLTGQMIYRKMNHSPFVTITPERPIKMGNVAINLECYLGTPFCFFVDLFYSIFVPPLFDKFHS